MTAARTPGRLAGRAALVLAALLAAAPAHAYRRTCPVENRRQYPCLRWPTHTIPWKVNPCRPDGSPSCAAAATADPALAAVQAGFRAWEDATHAGASAPCTDLSLPYAGTSGSILSGDGRHGHGEHVVIFRRGWCSDVPAARSDPCYQDATCGNRYDCFDDECPADPTQGCLGRGVLALTSVIFDDGGTILDADMEIVDWDGTPGSVAGATDGFYWTCYRDAQPSAACTTYGQGDCYAYDLQNTVTHEAGHFLGLAHPCGADVGVSCSGYPNDTTMYPTAISGETQKRTLADDDVSGICAIYPAPSSSAPRAPSLLSATVAAAAADAATTDAASCLAVAPRKKGWLCGTGPGEVPSLIVLALLVARRRRR
jgi:hypothetical protein